LILVAFVDEAEAVLRRRQASRRVASLEEESQKVLALLVRQLFLASRDWSLARRIGTSDPRQLLEWRVVVHSLEELGSLLGHVLREVNRSPGAYRGGEVALPDLLAEVRTHLKTVVEALIHPSLTGACETYGEVLRLRATLTLATARAGAAPAKHKLAVVNRSLERGAACLSTLAEVAIDHAVAAGNETVLLDAA
jgi:hypothetical protein